MLPAALAAAQKAGDDVGPDGADVADEVADDLVVPPFLDRLFDAEREAEVDRAGEVLLGAVEPVDGQQLLGAQHAERLEDLRADLVLPAVAARRGHERGPHAAAVAHHRQQRVVLVVGMRGRLHEGAGRLSFRSMSRRDASSGSSPTGSTRSCAGSGMTSSSSRMASAVTGGSHRQSGSRGAGYAAGPGVQPDPPMIFRPNGLERELDPELHLR